MELAILETPTNGLVEQHDGKAWTTSLIIAEKFDKAHKHVLEAIDHLECTKDFHGSNFRPTFRTVLVGNGAERESRFFEITRDGFVFLAMGFTGSKAAQWKERFIAAFNAATQQKSTAPKSSLQLIAMLAEESLKLERRVDNHSERLDQIEFKLTSEKVNEFPQGCERLDRIAEVFFPGMSKSKVSNWLHAIKHPTKEYKFATDEGELRSVAAFENDGIEEARLKLVQESQLLAETKMNVRYHHPLIGRFYIKRISHTKSFMENEASRGH